MSVGFDAVSSPRDLIIAAPAAHLGFSTALLTGGGSMQAALHSYGLCRRGCGCFPRAHPDSCIL